MGDLELQNKELFLPYYINQGRLLDIYAILNEGYSEYTEITTSLSSEKSKAAKGNASFNGGFKIFNIGGSVSGAAEKKDNAHNENKIKKVQTVSSILGIVKSQLEKKGYLKKIDKSNSGDFVCLPVNLQINSIKSLFSELSTLINLINGMKKIGIEVNLTSKESKEISNMMKSFQLMFNGEEILYETDDFAIIGNIFDEHLYQSVRADIIGTDLICLAQVKRFFPNGTELMKNTLFAKMNDKESKRGMIEAVKDLVEDDFFDFEATAVASITDKPVYQLELISLFQ